MVSVDGAVGLLFAGDGVGGEDGRLLADITSLFDNVNRAWVIVLLLPHPTLTVGVEWHRRRAPSSLRAPCRAAASWGRFVARLLRLAHSLSSQRTNILNLRRPLPKGQTSCASRWCDSCVFLTTQQRRDSSSMPEVLKGAEWPLASCSLTQPGHWTYECKNEAVYVSRPSRTTQLRDPKKQERYAVEPPPTAPRYVA